MFDKILDMYEGCLDSFDENKDKLIAFATGFGLCFFIQKFGWIFGITLPICFYYFGMTPNGRKKFKSGMKRKAKILKALSER